MKKTIDGKLLDKEFQYGNLRLVSTYLAHSFQLTIIDYSTITVNFFFIAIMQNMLLLAAELPQYLLLTLTPIFSPTYTMPVINNADYILSALFVVVIALEMLADNQQQIFQSFKAKALKAEKNGKGSKLSVLEQGKLTRGFVTEGLWSFSRHPVRVQYFSLSVALEIGSSINLGL